MDVPNPAELLAAARRQGRLVRQVSEAFDRTLGGYAAPSSPVRRREFGYDTTPVSGRVSAAHGPHFGIDARMRATIVADSVADDTDTPLVFTDPPADAGDGSIALDGTGESVVVTDTGFYAVTVRVAVTGASGSGHAEVTLTFDPDGDDVAFDDTRVLVPTVGAVTVFTVSATYWLEAGERLTGSIRQVSGAAADVAGHIAVARVSSHLIAEPAGEIVEPARFLVYGSTNDEELYYSDDGLTWALVGASPIGDNPAYIFHADGLWWAHTGDGLGYSADGFTWDLTSWGPDGAPSNGSIKYGGGLFIVSRGYKSSGIPPQGLYVNSDPFDPDGWVRTLDYPFSSGIVTGLAYGDGLWVFHITDGTASEDVGAQIYTSPDGVTWTQQVAPDKNMGASAALWFAGGLFFKGGWEELWVTPDGVNWTEVPGVSVSAGVLYVDGLYLAVGGGGFDGHIEIYTSPDGYSWTLRDLPPEFAGWDRSTPEGFSNSYKLGAVWGSGRFVVLFWADTGPENIYGFLTSEDGVTWELHDSQFGELNVVDAIAAGPR